MKDKNKNVTIFSIVGIVAIGLVGLIIKTAAPEKYSEKWFDSLTDDEFNAEREIVREEYCKGSKEAYRLLQLFNRVHDRKMIEYYKDHPYKYPAHREHGYHLPNDD